MDRMTAKSFGAYFKERRVVAGLTLRAFCRRHGFNPGNISKLERGRLTPPESEEKLTQYARALEIKRGSDEWYEFFDRAAADRGRIPCDILSDDEVLAKLPVLFRTIRGTKVAPSKLDELIERIRRA